MNRWKNLITLIKRFKMTITFQDGIKKVMLFITTTIDKMFPILVLNM